MTYDKNSETTWACREVHTPPVFDVKAFQSRINKILPPTPEGYPVVRLVWGASIKDTYEPYYCNWSMITGHGTETELRAKYRYATIKIPNTTDTFIDVPVPRWILEERNSFGQQGASFEAARFNKEGKEVRPPMPKEGYYTELATIAWHDGDCCAESEKTKVVCWGKYREPSQSDLDRLRRAVYLREQDAYIDPDKPLSAETLALIGLQTADKIQKKQEDADKALDGFIDEYAKEYFGKKPKEFSLIKG